MTNTGANSGGYTENLNASVSTSPSATGSGSISGLAAQSSSSVAVGVQTGAAGHITGAATVGLVSTGTGTSGLADTTLGSQTVAVSGNVYNLASAGVPTAVTVANQHVGGSNTASLTVTNSGANSGGYTENLVASVSTAPNATGGGSTGAIGAQSSASVAVGVQTSTAGNITGVATVGLVSTGTGTSGLADTTLTSQNVNVSGNVYNYANAALKLNGTSSTPGVTLSNDGTAQTSYTLNLGHLALNSNGGSVTAAFNALNLPSFADLLGGQWTSHTSTGSGLINYALQDFENTNRIAGGGTVLSLLSSLQVSTTTVGTFSGVAVLTWDGYQSDIGSGWYGTSNGQNTFKTITLNIVGDVYGTAVVAEPGILWLFGSASFAAWFSSRRKKATLS